MTVQCPLHTIGGSIIFLGTHSKQLVKGRSKDVILWEAGRVTYSFDLLHAQLVQFRASPFAECCFSKSYK